MNGGAYIYINVCVWISWWPTSKEAIQTSHSGLVAERHGLRDLDSGGTLGVRGYLVHLVCLADVCPFVEQQLDDLEVAVLSSHDEAGPSILHMCVCVCVCVCV